MAKYECKVCGYIYNEQYGGKTFEEMYSCPICDADKSSFAIIDDEPEQVNVWKLSDDEKEDEFIPVGDATLKEETVMPEEPAVPEEPESAMPKTEFVVERRQEFWADSEKDSDRKSEAVTEENNSEGMLNTWDGSVKRVLDFDNPDNHEGNVIQKEEPVAVEPVRNEFIETIYGNAAPVKTEEELKKEEEKKEAEEQKNLLNIGGGTVHTVLNPVEPVETAGVKENAPEEKQESKEIPWQPVRFDAATEPVHEPAEPVREEAFENPAEPAEEEEAFEFIEADENNIKEAGSVPDFFESTVEDFNQFGKSAETFFDDSEEDAIDAGQGEFFTVNDETEEAAGEYKEIIPEEEAVSDNVGVPIEESVMDNVKAPAEEPVMESVEAPAEKPVMESVEASAEEPVVENIEIPVEEPVVENIEIPVEEPVAEFVNIPVEETTEEVLFEENVSDTETPAEEESTAEEMPTAEETPEEPEEIFVGNQSAVEEEVVVYSMLKGRTKYSILCDEEARKMFDSFSVGEEAISNGLEDIILLPAQLNPVPLAKEVAVDCRTTIGRFTNCPVEMLQPFCFSKLILWGEHIPGRESEDDLSGQALILIKGKDGHIPDVSSKEEFRKEVLVAKVRSGGTPVGVDLIAGRIEKDLEACVYAGVDFVILNDVTSRILPYALRRAKNYLNRVNSKIEILVCVDALKDAQELAKMLAMGADLVLIERGFDLKMSGRIMEDLMEITRSTGHRNVHDINMTDICTIDGDIAANTDIDHV